MSGLSYLSVCSGIEAATVAWHPLGWRSFGFAEIEAFPSAVLAHHYGSNLPDEVWLPKNGVPNFGNIQGFKDWPDADIDVLVGGTPCQSFSIAGLRKGMDDPRGNLALVYLAIAAKYRPEWLVWENVPGVLSSKEGRDFGSFLGGLAELGYGFAYRVLDAQYVRVDGFGRAVPQRRRRVFVVGNSRDWRRAAAVLFERESLSWDSPPRRETGERIAPTISARPTGGGGLGTDFDCDGGLIASTGNVPHCLNAGAMGRIDYETETMVAHALKADGFDASEDGTGRGTPLIAFSAKDYGADAEIGIAPTLRAGGHTNSHANAGVMPAIAIQERAVSENAAAGPDGAGVRDDGASYTLEARTVPQAVAFSITPSNSNEDYNARVAHRAQAITRNGNRPSARGGDLVAERWAVRRLMPVECERLQGFPDGYTQVPYRGKPSADGPRYKALGNSMAVNVMRWIGKRIDLVNSISLEARKLA